MKCLALVPFALALLLTPVHPLDRLVTAAGEATVGVAPDAAVIRIGITSRGATACEAANQVTVRVCAIDNLATIVDRAMGAGANKLAGIELVVSGQSKLLD